MTISRVTSLATLCVCFVIHAASVSAETRTAFEFSRALDTCDEENDIALQSPGTARVVYAWNDEDPAAGGEPRYHGSGNRGSRSVNVASALPEDPVPEEDAFTINLNFTEHTMPDGEDTIYYCKMFALPQDQPLHVAKFSMNIKEENFANVHHLSMWECPNLPELAASIGIHEDDIVTNIEDGIQGDCGDPEVFHPSVFQGCQVNPYVYGYAVGANPITLPENVGFRIGQGGVRYLFAQMHYDMPDLQGRTDDSGVQFTVTTQLREHNLGSIFMGEVSLNLEPRQERIDVVTACTGDHINDLITATPDEEINILAVRVHSHLAGRAMKVQHVRDGTELAPVANSPFYDFDFQDALFLPTPRKVYPGDDFILTCTYSTLDRENVTTLGESTLDEMCFSWLMFWPAPADISQTCISAAQPDGTLVSLRNRMPFELPNITTPYEPPACEVQEYGSTEPGDLDVETLGEWKASFAHAQVLSNDGESFTLYWTADPENRTVRYGVDVATSGWVGFGLSPNGGMVNSDVMMAWVDDETSEVYFSDRKATAEALPIVDAQQDYFNIRGVQYEEVDELTPGSGPDDSDSTTPIDGGGDGSSVASGSIHVQPLLPVAMLSAVIVTVSQTL